MWEEFRKFIMRGNVVDLAVGVVIGAAFGAIVASLVADVIMPLVGAITGGNYYISLSSKVQQGAAYAEAKKQGAVIGYGQFLTIAVNFLIVAAVLFFVIRGMNRLSRKQEQAPKPAEAPADVKLLTEIRDILARGRA
jgi:large conductance mechanosensitive channel